MAIDRAALKAAINKAFQETMEELAEEVIEVINDPNAFSDQGFINQDIVDSGRFRESQDLNLTKPFSATFNWDPVDPESGFHYGAALFTGFWAWGHTYIPGREFPYEAIQRKKPVTRLAQKLKEIGFKVKFIDRSIYL